MSIRFYHAIMFKVLAVIFSLIFLPARIHAQNFSNVDAVIAEAIRNHAFPSAQLIVWQNGKTLYSNAYGTLTYTDKTPVTTQSLYDLASVTKAAATTFCIMKLYDEKKIALEDFVVKYLPDFGSHGKDKITIKNLLLHNGGLIAYRQYVETCHSAAEVMRAIYDDSLVYPIGTKSIYSDLDFILLAKVIEKITGKPLDVYYAENFSKPLGMTNTFFNPDRNLPVVPTEMPHEWEPREYGGLRRPLVNDNTAALLGGVSGHAGLFSTAEDLSKLMSMLMNGGKVGDKIFIQSETIAIFTKRDAGSDAIHSTRALGWDTKASEKSAAGRLWSDKTFGHLGFTGTSIWVDPTRNLFVIFLTNRVYPSIENIKIRTVRPLVQDAVIEALEKR
jgi:CubicO group peptidase (beta-lactamase class C family)